MRGLWQVKTPLFSQANFVLSYFPLISLIGKAYFHQQLIPDSGNKDLPVSKLLNVFGSKAHPLIFC